MAKKTKGVTPVIHYPKEPSYRYVKRAGMWCKTWFENGTQKQQWLTKEQYVGRQNTNESVGGK